MLSELGKDLAALLVPGGILKDFAIKKVESEPSGGCIIHLEEKEGLSYIPKDILHEGKAIANGFCNPIELLSFPANGKPLYLKIFRRRWRIRGTNRTASNSYQFNYPGMKTTKAFGDFLKGEI